MYKIYIKNTSIKVYFDYILLIDYYLIFIKINLNKVLKNKFVNAILIHTTNYLFYKSSIVPLQHVLYKTVLRWDGFNRILWVKVKNKPILYLILNRHTHPFPSSSTLSFSHFSLTLQNSCISISLFVCGSFLHFRTNCDSLPPLKTRRVSPPQPAVAGCGSPLHEQQQRAAFPPQQPPTILP